MQKSVAAKRKGGRPTSASTARLRKAILFSAEEAFMANGFDGARVEAIAAAAGTSKQTIYARFGTKESLFVAVSDKLLSTRFVVEVAEQGSLRDKLVALSIQMLDAMLDPKMVRMYMIINAEALRFPELARASDDDNRFPGRLLMAKILTEASEAGAICCGELRSKTLMLQDMVLTTPLRSAALGLRDFNGEERRFWAHTAVDLFLEGVSRR